MNNKEYWSQADARRTPGYKMIHAKLKKWKLENNITETCVVHHRDDTEETRKYNTEHYELWGFNEDGTFEYGKYIVFMTLSEHTVYHCIGKKHSEETKAKIRSYTHPNEIKSKISAHIQDYKVLYKAYINNGGALKWNAFQKALKNGEIIPADLN